MAKTLHKLVQIAIRRVEERNPAFSWCDAWSDIVRLNELAQAIDTPPPIEKVALLDIPLHVGDVTLWRLSFGAIEWLENCAEKWFEGNNRLIHLAYAWAMAHARQPAAIRAAWLDQDRGEELVFEWLRSITCPEEALRVGVSHFLPRAAQDPQAGGGQPAEYGEILDDVMSAEGGTVDYWLYEVPWETVRELWERIGRRKLRDLSMRLGVTITSLDKGRKMRAQRAYAKSVKVFEQKYAEESEQR